MEIEDNHSLNFLDLTISISNNKHNFKVFRKPTQTDMVIPNNSNHIFNQKLAVFHSWVHRLFKIPMENSDFEEEIKTIKCIASKNGYTPQIIERIIEHKQRKLLIKEIFPQNTIKEKEEEKRFVSIPYLGPVSVKIGRCLHD